MSNKTTRHAETCKMAFGRKDSSCPRCQELIAGGKPVKWGTSRATYDAQRLAEVKAHSCIASNCGSTCIKGEW